MTTPHYIGLTENTFKGRLHKHKNSFTCESKKNATKLSSFVWENKHANTEKHQQNGKYWTKRSLMNQGQESACYV